MPTARDPRYRGRRTRQQRPVGHLCTTYTDIDFESFKKDLERLYTTWPRSVKEEDERAINLMYVKVMAISSLGAFVPLTIFLVVVAINDGIAWYAVPFVQSAVVLYFFLLYIIHRKNDNRDTIECFFREAERRGIRFDRKKYDKDNIYYLVNRVNADYNSRLWNRKFKWT